MMGEWRAKAKGTQCPAEAGKDQHLAGEVGRVGQADTPGVNGSIRSPLGDHGESFQPALVRAGDQGVGRQEGTGFTAQLLLSFTPSLQPWGRISAAVLSS